MKGHCQGGTITLALRLHMGVDLWIGTGAQASLGGSLGLSQGNRMWDMSLSEWQAGRMRPQD